MRLLCKGAQRTHLLRGKLLFFGCNHGYGAENAFCARSYHRGAEGSGQQRALPSLGKASQVWWAPGGPGQDCERHRG